MKWGYGLAVVLIGGVVLTSLSFAKTIVEPQFAVVLAQENVNTIAEQITVMIDGPGDDEKSKGSGVIVRREGNIYYVLTNRHVVEKDGDYQVQTVDGNQYVVNYRQIQKMPGLDLAVLQFSSNLNYRVVTLANSDQVSRRQKIYVVGYTTPGPIFSGRLFIPTEGIILDRVQAFSDGYAFVYTLNNPIPGMSGGPVLDERGELIGINGLAQPDVRTGRIDLIAGIPTNTFRSKLVAITPVPIQPSPTSTRGSTRSTKTSSRFYCGRTVDDIPVTLARDPFRGSVPMIVWVSNFSTSGWSPEQRCKEVSAKLEQFYQSGQLKYLIAGTVNNRAVVCAVPDIKSRCSSDNILMIFSSEDAAKRFIEPLIQLNSGLSNSPSYIR